MANIRIGQTIMSSKTSWGRGNSHGSNKIILDTLFLIDNGIILYACRIVAQPYECPINISYYSCDTLLAINRIYYALYLTSTYLNLLISFKSLYIVFLTYECWGLSILYYLAKHLNMLEYKKGVPVLPWLKSITPLCLAYFPLAKVSLYFYALEVKNLKIFNIILLFLVMPEYYAIF